VTEHERPPHLRPVPPIGSTEEVDVPPAIQIGAVEQPPPPVAPVIGLGDMPAPTTAGVLASLGPHALAVIGTGGTGAAVGLLASGEARGAVIGAGAQLTLLGLAGAVFGAGRMPSWLRIAYGVLALGGAATAGYLVWTRE